MLSSRSILKSNPPINQLVWLVNEQPLAKIMATSKGSLAGVDADRDPTDHLISHLSDQPDGIDQRSVSTFIPERQSPIEDEDAYNNGALLNQSGWRFVPTLNLSQTADRYRPGSAWNELVVTFGINVSTARVQCLAISSFGQTMSSKVDLNLPYSPRCYSPNDTSGPDTSLSEMSQLLGLQVHSITSLYQTSADTLFACPVQANPEPLEISWSFVPLEELSLNYDALGEQSNLSAVRVKVSSTAMQMSRDEIMTISGQGSTLPRGLLMCHARNKLGWQDQKACVNLLVHVPEQSSRPSAENCTIGAHVEQSKEHLLVDVDCSLIVAKERLIFQMAVLRQDSHRNSFIVSPESELNSVKRFLFTSSQARGPLRISMDEIQANMSQVTQLQPIAQDDIEKLRRANGLSDAERPIKMTLKEQVDLLKSLVFVIRASDLVSVSEAHAIYGSDLRVELEESSLSSGSRDKQPLASIQVSRSSGQGDLGDESLQHGLVTNARLPASVRVQSPIILGHDTKLKQISPYEFEVGITIVAICCVVVLSFLTITLIVIVLNRRDRGDSGLRFKRRKKCKKREDIPQEDRPAHQVQLVRLDPGFRARTLESAQTATTRDMLALPASSQRSQTESSGESSRRTSLNLPQYGSAIYQQPCRSHLPLVENERRMLAGASADVHQAQIIKTDSSFDGRQEANETLYLIEAEDVCAANSPATTTSPECQPFITLADCELNNQTAGLTSSNFCSSSNHNSLSFCDECSLTVTLTTSDLAIIPGVAPCRNQKLGADEDSSMAAYEAKPATTVCNKVYLLDPF